MFGNKEWKRDYEWWNLTEWLIMILHKVRSVKRHFPFDIHFLTTLTREICAISEIMGCLSKTYWEYILDSKTSKFMSFYLAQV